MKTLYSSLVISLFIVLCGCCKTRHDEVKKENDIFQQEKCTNEIQQVSQFAADIIHELNLSTRRAIVVSQRTTSSNSVTSITEEIVIPASPAMSDGYAYTIKIDHTTRQYWWTKQGGFAGTIERHGPILYQQKQSNKVSEAIAPQGGTRP